MMDSGVMSSSATGQAGRGQRLTTAEEAARYAPYHALVERVAELDAYCRHCSARTALRTTLSEIRL